MKSFDKLKALAVQEKLKYTTPGMILTALSTISLGMEDIYQLIYKLVDTYTYHIPVVEMSPLSFEFKIIDNGYKEFLNHLPIELKKFIIITIDETNTIFGDSIKILLQDVLPTDEFWHHSRLYIDKTVTNYIRTMPQFPIYELVYFPDNIYLKNLVMINFLTQILLELEGKSTYTILTRMKTTSEVVPPELYEVTGGTQINMLDIIISFVEGIIKKRITVSKTNDDVWILEWVESDYIEKLNKLFNEPIKHILSERLLAFDRNLNYMCNEAHNTLYPNQPMTENSILETLPVVHKNLKDSSMFPKMHFDNSIFKNMLLSYLY